MCVVCPYILKKRKHDTYYINVYLRLCVCVCVYIYLDYIYIEHMNRY